MDIRTLPRKSAFAAVVLALMAGSGCKTSGMDLAGMMNAGTSMATAASMTEDDIRQLGDQTIAQMDKQNKVAAPGSKYSKRIAALTRDWKSVDGKALEYKVYLSPQVNGFAVPNGSIRIYSGLLDAFSDDEVRYVLAHEIGHVVLGHSKKAFQVAYASSAARQAAAASGNSAVAAISASELGALGEKLLNAQFSQKQENEADDYAVDLMKKSGKNAAAAVTALRKLEKMGGNKRSVFSSHPAPGDRADRMAQKVAAR